MFDEKNGRWIRLFKGFTVVMFWVYIVAGVVLCICGWSWVFRVTHSTFLDGIIGLACGLFMAFLQLFLNMLIIQLLNNVQIIREKVENM